MSYFSARFSASPPGTLPAYLTSIGKDSWYGGFLAPNNLYSDISNTIPVTTDGAAWRNWLPYQSAGGFSASFGQTTGSRRCALGTSRNGKPGVYANGVDWYASLDSTTALNRPYTVLMSAWVPMTAITGIYSHNISSHALLSSTGTPTIRANGVSGPSVESVFQSTPPASGTTIACRIGWSTNGTGHYNNSPNLFRFSNNQAYSDSTIHELWFTERLTAAEITEALKFLA